MNSTARIFILLAAMTFAGSAPAQTLGTNPLNLRPLSSNDPAANLVATTNPASTDPSTNVNEILPLVEMSDVPITTAIEQLARTAGINYLLDPQLMQTWIGSTEPIVNFRLRNISAREVLLRLLEVRNLALVEDPDSNIAFITRANRLTNGVRAGLPGKAAIAPAVDTNAIIPLIQFSDVPITSAIEHLARQEGINYLIDPKLCRLWKDAGEPVLSFRLEKVTAWNALNRMLNIRNFVLITDPVTQVARIARSDEPMPAVDASLLGLGLNQPVSATNGIIPLIQFQDVPLDFALANLVRQSSVQIELDPRLIDSDDTRNLMKTKGIAAMNDEANPVREPRKNWFDPMPVISIRWEDITINQAIVALCENYELVISRDAATGMIEIKPKEVKKHHRLPSR